MIFAPVVSMQIDAEGIGSVQEQVAADLQSRLPEPIEIAVVAGGKRGALKNALIAHAQANQQRDPFYLNKRAMEVIRFLAKGLVSKAVGVRESAAKQMGDAMLISIGENVQGQRNPKGDRFRPLTAGYALRKQRKHGFTIPILKATGDLLSGLRVRITKGSR